MKGTLRFLMGFVIVFGAQGGIEVSTNDFDLAVCAGIAALGLMLIYSGANALRENV